MNTQVAVGNTGVAPRVAVALCNVYLYNSSNNTIRYSISGVYGSSLLYPGVQQTIPVSGQVNRTRITINPPSRVETNGRVIGNGYSTTQFSPNSCNQYFTILDGYRPSPGPLPPIPPPNFCSTSPYPLQVANAIISGEYNTTSLIQYSRPLTVTQLNTPMCLPQIDNAYFTELAVIYGYPELLKYYLSKGADPNLTTEPNGLTLVQQLLQNPNGGRGYPQSLEILLSFGGR